MEEKILKVAVLTSPQTKRMKERERMRETDDPLVLETPPVSALDLVIEVIVLKTVLLTVLVTIPYALQPLTGF